MEGPTGTSTSALGVTYSNFITNAPGAFWSNNDGGIPWGIGGDSRGSAKMQSGWMEDGLSHSFLYTQPKWANNSYMHGSYAVTIPVATQHPTLTATFGFVNGGGTGDGVIFSVKANLADGSGVTLFTATKTSTSSLWTRTADLSAYAGQTLNFVVSAETGASYSGDWPGWTDLRITTDTAVEPADCMIGGVHYAKNDANPAVSCQICDPTASTTAWTTRGDSCLIGGTCYSADQLDTLGCKKCDPMTSQSSWTTKAACDNLIVSYTGPGPGAFGTNPDGYCQNQGAAVGLPGNWKAMLSTNSHNYKDTVAPVYRSMPVTNLKGEQLYSNWDAIFTNQVWPSGLSIYGFGNTTTPAGSAHNGQVWTGSNADGTLFANADGDRCSNWTSNGYNYAFFLWHSYHAAVGDWGSGSRKLITNGAGDSDGDCTGSRPIACVLVPPGPIVTTQNYDGTAEGDVMAKTVARGDAFAWLGVPYAAPPTGNLRFAPPAKVSSWSGTRNAFSMPAHCAQKGFFPGVWYIGSEDCLYLNVWAPKTATPTSNLPVFVFHHGGGLMFGSSSAVDDIAGQGIYDGDRLAAAQNMVVVTLQTRLAALGYLALPELSANSTSRTSTIAGGTSGNYGLLDALQALKWIKKNISKFGGDPTHVTFAGQSGGASLAGQLVSSPLAKDPADNKTYFSSALLMSGFYEEPTMATRYTQGTAALPIVHCESASDKVACLRSAALNDITAMGGDFLVFVPNTLNGPVSPDVAFGLAYGPNIDGYVLPAQPRVTMAAGNHQKVPVIVGSTQKEFSSFMILAVAGVVHALTTGDISNMVYLPTCSAFVSRTDLNLGSTLAATARAMYPCNPLFFLGPTTAYSDAMTHVQYECPARRTARALVTGPSPATVRRYQFNHSADNIGVFQNLLGLVRQVGPAHALDLPYIFGSHSTIVLGLPTYWPSQRELELTNRYGKYIRAFAATGDPNYTGGAAWAAYDKALDNALSLKVVGETGPSDPGPQMISGIDTSYCDFWDNNFTLDGWK